MIRSPAGYDGGDRIKRYLDYYQPSYGVMMLSAGQFSPALLFAAGEVGAWYDPSDFSTLFQDSSGTTPVTAVEQSVGLVLDKSKNAIGSNGTQRLNLLTYSQQFDNGAWALLNIFAFGSGSIANATTAPDGTLTADLITPNTTNGVHRINTSSGPTVASSTSYTATLNVKPNGYTKFGLIENATTGAYAAFDCTGSGSVLASGAGGSGSITNVGDGWYKLTLTLTTQAAQTTYRLDNLVLSPSYTTGTIGGSWIPDGVSGVYLWGADLRLTSNVAVAPVYQPITASWAATISGNHATQATSANRPVLSARVNQLLATATLATQNVTTRAATYTLAFSGAGTVTASGTNVGVYSAGVNSLTCTAGTLTLTVSGSVTLADLRVTNDGVGLPAYQAVITSTNYDTSGFPLYLSFDGTNDSLATGTITPGTNKVQVFAGVRKLSDAAQAIVAELSATIASNAGSFALTAPNSAAANYNFSSKGTTQTDNVVTTYTSPLTNVLSGIGDIAGPSNVIRVNGAQVGSVITTQGTGNYLAYPLYIGRRAGTSLAFTGNIYSLIIRFGSNLPTSTIAQTETWVNGKTLAY